MLQLIKVLDSWAEALDEGLAVDVVYCDFMKAFHRVPHKRLMEKISTYNIKGGLLTWIKKFLTGTRQRVLVNGEASSEWKEVYSGVPQGSLLGPLLFVLFINDLPQAVTHGSQVFFYAHDTKIFSKITDAQDCDKLQQDLDGLKQWTEKWLLNFQPEKSRHMPLGRTKVDDREYTMYGYIEKTRLEKDMGVVIDDKLKFSDHLAEKINKANRIVGLIRRTFIHLDSAIFKPFYTALVRPHLEYICKSHLVPSPS